MSPSTFKLALIATVVAYVEARFGQENVPSASIQALGDFGQPGEAATLSGAVPGTLLGATDPCEKLLLADQIVATLGNDPAVIAAAAGLVAAEQNVNPFAASAPNVCGDASLPATEALRGITPLVDPDFDDSDVANALSAQTLQNPLNANGLSVADLMQANGVANLAVDGVAQGGGAGGNAGNGNDNNAGNGQDNGQDNGNDAGDDAEEEEEVEEEEELDDGAVDCGGGNVDNGNDNDNDAGDDAGNDAGNGGNVGAGGADFGLCDPRMDIQFGRGNRDASEGTFLPVDSLVAEGQQDALNPNIITNRICDQLINVCEANDEAIAVCEDAQAEVEASGDRSAAAADLFNSLLGF